MHGVPLVRLQSSNTEGYNCFSLSPVRTQMLRRKIINAQKGTSSLLNFILYYQYN